MPAVAAFEGAKTYSLMRQPKSGRMGRSPGAVARTMRIASSSSSCRVTSAMLPVASVRIGKAAQPDPTNSSVTPDPLVDLHQAGVEIRHAPAVEIKCATSLDGCGRPGDLHRPGRLDARIGARLDAHAGRPLEGQVLGRLDVDVLVALHRHVLRAVDLDLPALGVDRDLRVLLVDVDLEVRVRAEEVDAGLALVVVVEDERVAEARGEGPHLDLLRARVDDVGDRGERLVGPVVDRADHVRTAEVALLERDEHLVLDLRDEHGAVV